MRIVISQPRYLPALNYLQRICFADVFVVFDIVQRQSRGWENRNQLLLPNPRWLTIPVAASSRALISDAHVAERDWIKDHYKAICENYRAAPHYDEGLLDAYFAPLSRAMATSNSLFGDMVVAAIKGLFDELSLPHNIVYAREFCGQDVLTAPGPAKLRLICEKLGATTYISGPNGRDYGVTEAFEGSSCAVVYHEYRHPVYPQVGRQENFLPHMGFFDALFCMGRDWFVEQLLTPPDFLVDNILVRNYAKSIRSH